MGSNQSTYPQDQMSYLAISPSPFVSLVKRSDHGLSDSMRSSSLNISSRPAQDSAYSSKAYYVGRNGEQKVARPVEQKVCEAKSLNIQDTNQAHWIPQVVCDQYSSGVSRERQRLTGYLSRDEGVCSNHGCKHPRRELYGSGARTCPEVGCREANMNAVNSGEVNTIELNTDEVNTTGDFTILHDEHYIITQDRDRTSDELNINGAHTNRECSPSHQQHNCVSTNNEMFYNLPDSSGSPVKIGEIPEVNISPRDVSERKLVQCCLKTDKANESETGGFTCQLSVTESCLEEMTEEDQGFGCRDLDSSTEEIQLVERGCSFHEQDHNDGDEKRARHRNLHSQNGACVQQTEQGDPINGHAGRVPRGTTETMLSPENKENIDHLACGSRFPGQNCVVASSNYASSYVSGISSTATPNLASSYVSGISNTATPNLASAYVSGIPSTATPNLASGYASGISNTATPNLASSYVSGISNTATPNLASSYVSGISNTATPNLASSYVSGISNTATPNKHDIYSLHLGCSNTSPGESLSSTPHGHESRGQLQTYSLSPGTNSICENRLQTAKVYVHPITGEFHSMIFGSIAGDATSMAGCSRTFSNTQECAPESHGYSMNHTDLSFGTGSFTCSLQSSTDNPSCDFHPDDKFAVQVGRAGLFDSFHDSVHSCSLDHTSARCKADQNTEEKAQGTEIEKVVAKKQQIRCLESDGSGKYSQARLQTREAISSCESCSIATSSMIPVFGCKSGSLCYKCSSHPQLLAQDTNSFSEIASSHCRSQHSCDSWRDSLQKPGTTQKVSTCFVDYDSDYCEFSASQLQQRQLKDICKCETATANKDKGNMFTGTQEIDKCETATENYGLNGKARASPSILTFGDRCLAFCSNIFKSQRLAENNIRRTDTQAFDNSAAYSNINSLTPSQNEHKHVTQAGMGCNSERQQFLEEAGFADQAKTESESCAKSSPESKQFNSSILKPDNGREFRKPLSLARSNQANNSNWAQDDDCDNNRSDLDSSRQNRHRNNARCNEQHLERGRNRSENNRVRREEEMSGERCLLQIQHSRSLSCDCGHPFKQNYVAYLCCAPEDLSSFGLTFHNMLESWGFRIFIAPRDLELTGPKYDNMARWLEERCNGKIIVILSKNYEKSDECLFLTYFARTLDPDSKYRNIIPVMIDKDVEIPNVLKGLSIIKYNYDFRCGWLKRKLVNAIAA